MLPFVSAMPSIIVGEAEPVTLDYPSVASTSSAERTTSGNFTFTLPSGIVAGDLVVIATCSGKAPSGTPSSISTPSGFTSLFNVSNSTWRRLQVFYRVATTSMTSVTMNCPSSTAMGVVAHRITNHSVGLGYLPAYATDTGPLSLQNWNPPSCSVPAEFLSNPHILALAVGATSGRMYQTSNFPSGYTTGRVLRDPSYLNSGASTTYASVGMSGALLRTESAVNPGSATPSGVWTAATVLIRGV